MALTLPNEPTPGQPASALHIAQIIRYCKALTSRLNTFELGSGRGRKTSAPPPHPFFLTSSVEGGSAKITVTPGVINNIVPTIDGVSLASSPAPKITVVGVGVLRIKCDLDANGIITNAIIETAGAGPLPGDTPALAYRVLGSFVVSQGQFTSLWSALRTNQSHWRCAGVSSWGQA